jgi:hypothetical protein
MLIVSRLLTKHSAFYGTPSFITSYTKVCYISFSINFKPLRALPLYFLYIPFNIILESTHIYSKWSVFIRFPYQNPWCTSVLPPRDINLAHLNLLILLKPAILGEQHKLRNSSLQNFFPVSCLFPRVRPQTFNVVPALFMPRNKNETISAQSPKPDARFPFCASKHQTEWVANS